MDNICPSCGALVQFKSRFSTSTVCTFCQSLLCRQDKTLIYKAKMALLAQDMSFLQIGSQGKWQNKSFEIIGQLKVNWRDGYWNEWYCLEQTGACAWLGEAMGFLSYAYEIDIPESFNQNHYNLNDSLTLNGTTFQINDIKQVVCAGCDGELPFEIIQGMAGISIDLATHHEDKAYIEIFDQHIRAYQGKMVTFEALALTNLREIDGW